MCLKSSEFDCDIIGFDSLQTGHFMKRRTLYLEEFVEIAVEMYRISNQTYPHSDSCILPREKWKQKEAKGFESLHIIYGVTL